MVVFMIAANFGHDMCVLKQGSYYNEYLLTHLSRYIIQFVKTVRSSAMQRPYTMHSMQTPSFRRMRL
jgi:hypothetical protein